jgi:hypothetical protein
MSKAQSTGNFARAKTATKTDLHRRKGSEEIAGEKQEE